MTSGTPGSIAGRCSPANVAIRRASSPDQLPVPGARVAAVFANPDAATLDRLAAEVAASRLTTPIQQTYALDQIGDAFAAFGAGTRGKLAVAIA